MKWIKTDDECPDPGETVVIKRHKSEQIEIALYSLSKTWMLKNYTPINFKPEFWIRVPKLYVP